MPMQMSPATPGRVPPGELSLRITRAGTFGTVVRAQGEADPASHDRIVETIQPLFGRDAVVVLDAEALDLVDSGGVRALVRLANQAAERGAHFRLAALQPQVARVIELCAAGVLDVREDVADALVP